MVICIYISVTAYRYPPSDYMCVDSQLVGKLGPDEALAEIPFVPLPLCIRLSDTSWLFIIFAGGVGDPRRTYLGDEITVDPLHCLQSV